MDCLRSFNVGISVQRGFTTAGTNVKTWGTLGNQHWQVIETTLDSDFVIEGFKRFDLYGIRMIGNVFTDLGANDANIVSDYGMQIVISGTTPLASGRTISSGWPLTITPNTYQISKFTNFVDFESPITGATNIRFGTFIAQGNNAETINSITLDIALNFVFYYKYEGE